MINRKTAFTGIAAAISLTLAACSPQEPVATAPTAVAEAPTPTTTPTLIPSPTPETPPTPAPSEPGYAMLQRNLELMDIEQADQYISQLSMKERTHWTGKVIAKEMLNDGRMAILVEMDGNVSPRPDLVLAGIANDLAQRVSEGQVIRFSGTLSEFTDLRDLTRLITMTKVTIHDLP